MTSSVDTFRLAVHDGDAPALRQLLDDDPAVRALLDETCFSFSAPAVVHAAGRGDRAVVDVLLDAGADIDRVSEWGAGGFSALHHCALDDRALAEHLLSRGATLDVFGAAALERMEWLEGALDSDSELVGQRGPDGQLPLHYAATPAVADLLLERGAEIDARCVDHDSTALQYAVVGRDAVARHLVACGASADIFVLSALGELEAVRALVAAADDVAGGAAALEAHLAVDGYAPVAATPGNILCWRLSDFGHTPHRIAKARGHAALYEWLCIESPPAVALTERAFHGEVDAARALLTAHPGLLSRLGPAQTRSMADAAWARNVVAVETMLELGFDPHARGDHLSTPLDRACFHGFDDVVALLLKRDPAPPLAFENEFGGTPIAAVAYGKRNGWRDDGDHLATARLLLDAGSEVPKRVLDYTEGELAALLRAVR